MQFVIPARLRVRNRDRGAVSIIVALLVPVLLGMTALAVDGGSIYLGRQNAQTAADAAALALAKACSTNDTVHCTENVASSGLIPLATANVRPGTAEITSLCVQKGGSNCGGASLASLPACPYSIPPGSNAVRANVRTNLRLIFAPIWGRNVATPSACASAVYGKVGSITTVLPITFSSCEWSWATGGDPATPGSGIYPPAPPYPPYPASFERKIYLQAHGPIPNCHTFNGHDAPGGFGWVSGGSGTCGQAVTLGSWIQVDTGNNVPTNCTSFLNDMKTSDEPIVYLPVYDCERKVDPGSGAPQTSWDCNQASGSNGFYHIVGYAKFYLTGWYLGGSNYKASPTLGVPCSNGDRCISGYFLKGLVDQGDISNDPSTPDFGVRVIKMVG